MKSMGATIGIVIVAFGMAIAITDVVTAPGEPHTVASPKVVMEVLDPSLEIYAPMWRDEIARRFDNAVGILVHGGDLVEGVWVLGVGYGPHLTPAAEIVRHYQRVHPNRTLILLACNTGNVELGIPGVYYSPSSTWCVPDRAITPEMYGLPIVNATLTSEDCAGGEGCACQPATTQPAEPAVVFIKVEPEPTRWEEHPDYVGNVWEMVCD